MQHSSSVSCDFYLQWYKDSHWTQVTLKNNLYLISRSGISYLPYQPYLHVIVLSENKRVQGGLVCGNFFCECWMSDIEFREPRRWAHSWVEGFRRLGWSHTCRQSAWTRLTWSVLRCNVCASLTGWRWPSLSELCEAELWTLPDKSREIHSQQFYLILALNAWCWVTN